MAFARFLMSVCTCTFITRPEVTFWGDQKLNSANTWWEESSLDLCSQFHLWPKEVRRGFPPL